MLEGYGEAQRIRMRGQFRLGMRPCEHRINYDRVCRIYGSPIASCAARVAHA